jgi:hypothetical protein
MSDEVDWEYVLRTAREVLDAYRKDLPKDATEAVEHYLAHDEFEMGVEGLCIELLKLPSFRPEHRAVCRDLARLVGLDREAVFDPTVWSKLDTDAP